MKLLISYLLSDDIEAHAQVHSALLPPCHPSPEAGRNGALLTVSPLVIQSAVVTCLHRRK